MPLLDSNTDSRDRDVEPRSLQLRKGRQNEQHDAMTEESSWDTQGLEAGTADESWTTTAGDVVDFAPPKITTQESTSQSAYISTAVVALRRPTTMHRLNALTPIPFDSDAILLLSSSSTLIPATVRVGMRDADTPGTTTSVVVSGMESMPTSQT
jgi:hypothetical protein